MKQFFYKSGALTCEEPIEGVTQALPSDDSIKYYGKPYFICETIYQLAAEKLAEKLGGELVVL